jgi:CHASE1-domain containing sensor protein
VRVNSAITACGETSSLSAVMRRSSVVDVIGRFPSFVQPAAQKNRQQGWRWIGSFVRGLSDNRHPSVRQRHRIAKVPKVERGGGADHVGFLAQAMAAVTPRIISLLTKVSP